MVLVPPYVEVDGLVVPLHAYPPSPRNGHRASVGHAHVDLKSKLAGLHYALSELLYKEPTEILRLMEARQDLPMPQELYASYWSADETTAKELAKHARNWEELTGARPDLQDVYSVGASFAREDLVIPRLTFIKLMTKLYELNAAVREGRMEPRIDESIPMPPPRPPPPPPKWTDEELQALEEDARYLDEIDPLTEDLSEARTAKRAEDRRGYVFAMLEVAYKRIRDGEHELPERYAQLGLTELLRYQAAFAKLEAYLNAPGRIAIVEPTIAAARRAANVAGPVTCAEHVAAEGFEGVEGSPCWADVSVDLFRLPQPPIPDGLSELEWLARCEAVFLHSRITGVAANSPAAGDLFTRILGHRVRMRYRPEMSAVQRLWRVELV